MMGEAFLIYALAVSGNIGTALTILGVCAAVVTLFATVVIYSDGTQETKDGWKPWLMRLLPAGITIALLGAAIPSAGDIMRAYAMIEGAKIVNAQNAEEVGKQVGARMDRFLKALEKRAQ